MLGIRYEPDPDQLVIFKMKSDLGFNQICIFRMESDLGFEQFAFLEWNLIWVWINFFLLQSIKFDHVQVQAGSDSTGVATDMITMNSTLKFTYRNTGTFFGVHVAATPLELSYSEIVIAAGNVRFVIVLAKDVLSFIF